MIIIASKSGQLGNRLFQFAHFIAFSAQSGVTILNPGFEEYADNFESTYRSATSRYPASSFGLGLFLRPRATLHRIALWATFFFKTRKLGSLIQAITLRRGEEFQLDDPAFEASIRKMRMLFIYGYEFRARSYFTRHAGVIRKYFTPRQHHRLQIDSVMAAAREKADIVIGVHIRRGDYRKFLGGRYFYELPVYLEMMKAAQKLFEGKRVCFLVCSNEKLNPADFLPLPVAFGTGQQIEDLYAFARCDYLIGPPSSYTLWAGFYGNCPLHIIWNETTLPCSLSDFQVPSEERRLVF